MRVFWDESEEDKIVVVEVEGEGLKEEQNLTQSKFFTCGKAKWGRQAEWKIEVTGIGKGVGIISVF